MNVQPFSPSLGGTITIAASTTSAQGALVANQQSVVRVANATTAIAFVRFTNVLNEVATAADTPVMPNTVETFSHVQGQQFISVVLSTGTGNVYATTGEGQ